MDMASGVMGSAPSTQAAPPSASAAAVAADPSMDSSSQEDALTSALNEWVLADTPEAELAPRLRLEVATERPFAAASATQFQAVLSIVAPPDTTQVRAPLRLVAVLDKSGSMQGEKLRLVAQTMRFMLQHLSERDALGLVEYDTRVNVLAPLTRCDVDGRQRLEQALGKLRAGSQTNLSGGLLRGFELHSEGVRETTAAPPMQRLCFGNTYRRLSEEEARTRASDGVGPPPAGYERIHEWTMELRFESSEDAARVQRVVYKLHPTFAQPVVDGGEAPAFRLSRLGWGTFPLGATLHLDDGRILELEHELSFERRENFKTLVLPLRIPGAPSALDADAPQADADDMAAVRSTFLFTDGLANHGITKTEDICAAVSGALAELGERQCSLSTFGFGADHSADLLQGLADAGSGIYSYVENEDMIGTAFGEALGGLLSTTHQNVRLSLDLLPGTSFLRAHTSYSVSTSGGDGGGQVLTVELEDLFADERRDILVDLALPVAAAEGPQHLGSLRARGFSVFERRSEEVAPLDLVVERRADLGAIEEEKRHPQVERHRNRGIMTDALAAARNVARNGDLAGARQCLESASEALGRSPLTLRGDAACLGFVADVHECRADLRSREEYIEKGSKKMACMQGSHSKQRVCGGQSFSAAYRNATTRSVGEAFSKG